MSFFKRYFIVYLVLILFLTMPGCGDDDNDSKVGNSGGDVEDTTETFNYLGTDAEGCNVSMEEVWDDSTYSTATFELTDTQDDGDGDTWSGDIEASQEPGFMLLNLTESTVEDFDGETYSDYMVSSPGIMNIIIPCPYQVFDETTGAYGVSGTPNIMVEQGECLSEEVTYNFIFMPSDNWGTTGSPAYGTAAFSLNEDSTWDIDLALYDISGNSLGVASFEDDASCEDGIITAQLKVEGDLADISIYISEEGLLAADLGSGEGMAIGVKQPDEDIDLGDLFEDGNAFTGASYYSTCVYADESSGHEAYPIYAETDGDEKILITMYDKSLEEDDNRLDASERAFTNVTQPSPGLIKATFEDGDGVHNVAMIIIQIDDVYYMFSINDSDTGESETILLIEQ